MLHIPNIPLIELRIPSGCWGGTRTSLTLPAGVRLFTDEHGFPGVTLKIDASSYVARWRLIVQRLTMFPQGGSTSRL